MSDSSPAWKPAFVPPTDVEDSDRATAPLQLGPLCIDVSARRVALDGADLPLTALQFDLLLLFAKSAGKVLAFDEIHGMLPRLQTGRRDPSVVRYHVARLRARLGSFGLSIENVRGCGYRMRPCSARFTTQVSTARA